MKKAISLFMMLCILLSLVACGKQKKPTNPLLIPTGSENSSDIPAPCPLPDTKTSQKIRPNIPESLYFINPQTIRFLMQESNNFLYSDTIVSSENSGYSVDVAAWERNKRVEKTLNVKIETDTFYENEIQDRIIAPLLSGIYSFDVLGIDQYYCLGLAFDENSKDMFINFEDSEIRHDNYIDISKPYWNEALYKTMAAYNGAAYFVTGDLSQRSLGSTYVSFVNADLWNNYKDTIASLPSANGITDVYTLISEGLWTMDLWNEIANSVWVDHNENEKTDVNDTVGFLANYPSENQTVVNGLAAGSGVQYCVREISGNWQITIDQSRNNLFFQKLHALYTNTHSCLVPNQDEHIMEIFSKGNALLTINQLYTAKQYLNNMKGYTILPLPKLSSSDFYSTTTSESTMFSLPYWVIFENKLDAVTATLEMMAYLSYTTVTPAYFESLLRTHEGHENFADCYYKTVSLLQENHIYDPLCIYGYSSISEYHKYLYYLANCQSESFLSDIPQWHAWWEDLLPFIFQ